MTDREIYDLGVQLAALQATVREQGAASVKAHAESAERNRELNAKIDTLLDAERQLGQRVRAIEVKVEGGLKFAGHRDENVVANTHEIAEELRSLSERMSEVEQGGARRQGAADQNRYGVTTSVAVISIIVAGLAVAVNMGVL